MTRENGKCHDALFAIALCYVSAKDLLWGGANDAKRGCVLGSYFRETLPNVRRCCRTYEKFTAHSTTKPTTTIAATGRMTRMGTFASAFWHSG